MLEIEGLNLSIGGKPILRNVNLSIGAGEILGVVGESGSGKSLTALSVMRLLPNFSELSGSARFEGEELVGASERRMRQLRGNAIGMVFQEPMTALNPLMTIGDQIAEGIRLHAADARAGANRLALEIQERVGLPSERVPQSRYPHELSGGQRQRVGIAIACAMNPGLLIADEPTTALDVMAQARILDLIERLVRERGTGLMLISHDLAVVARMADRIAIMKEGEIVEQGDSATVLSRRRHACTRSLISASTHMPKRSERVASEGGEALLKAESLACDYVEPRRSIFSKRSFFRAVDSVDLEIRKGQALGLAGESGCGKSTLARTIMGLQKPSSGRLSFRGFDLASGDSVQIEKARRRMQIVFQDPYGSFDPRHRVSRLVGEPLDLRDGIGAAEKRERIADALDAVGIPPSDALERYPHEFSGGQRQRLAIARALVVRPSLIVADEPVSSLDVSIRARILDLLSGLRERFALAWLFISHDLQAIRAVCDDVAIMQAGKIIERGSVDEIFRSPTHRHTRELLKATPDLQGEIESRLKKSPVRNT